MKDSNAIKLIQENRRCIDKIRRMIETTSRDKEKFYLIKYYLYFCTNNITGIYSDEFIEKEIIKYGKEIEYFPSKIPKENTALMVMTTSSAIGGHTALVNNWIQFEQNRSYSIVFTDSTESMVPDFLRKTVTESGGKLYFLKNDDVSKAKELLLLAEEFENIFLHIHMYDLVPLIAFSNKEWKKPIYFYNHANFLFSIGVSISDVMLNICEYDRERSEKYRGSRNAEVLPIPQKVINRKDNYANKDIIKKELRSKYKFDEDGSILLSMGDDFKYKKTEKIDFTKFVMRLMEQLPDNTFFYVIGANPHSWQWKKLKYFTKGKAKAIGVQSRDNVSKWMQIADAYIVSFPMNASGSGEAWEKGVPCFRYNPIGRGVETVSRNENYDDIDYMIDEIKRCINKEKIFEYTPSEICEIKQNPELWRNRLNAVISLVDKHENHDFKNVPIIETEEIINVQLLNRIRGRYPYPMLFYQHISIFNQFKLFVMQLHKILRMILFRLLG